MTSDTPVGSWEESVDVRGRHFVLLVEGPVPPGRYEIRIWEGTRGARDRQYLRAPIRGHDVEEARERALEVLHNYVGLDRFRALVEEIVGQVAPGAEIEVAEDARDVTVRLRGRHPSSAPLVIPRSDVLNPDADEERLRAKIRTYLQTCIRTP
jgi:hypothetical protein